MEEQFHAPVGPKRPAVLVVSVLIELLLCLFIGSRVRIGLKDRGPSGVCPEWRVLAGNRLLAAPTAERCRSGDRFTDVIDAGFQGGMKCVYTPAAVRLPYPGFLEPLYLS